MMQLDTPTVLFFIMLLCGSQAVVTLLFYRLARHYKGVFAWTLGNIAIALGYVLISWRDMIPDFVSIIVANAIILSAPWCFWFGVKRYLEQPVRLRSLLWLPLGGTLLIFYFAYINPDLNARALVSSLVNAVLYTLTGLTLITVTDVPTRFSNRFTGLIFTCYGLFFVMRSFIFFQTPATSIFDPTPIQTASLIFTALAAILWTAGFVVMITERLLIELRFTATHDFLTRTLNRRAAHTALEAEMSRSIRTNIPFSVLLLDIDHFKRINDRFGHVVGDKVLMAVAADLLANVRHGDLVARWGGEEFLVILTATGAEGALSAAHRLCDRINTLALPFASTRILCTISVGAATFIPPTTTLQDVVTHADIALYHAKHSGRNCVVAYSPMLDINFSTPVGMLPTPERDVMPHTVS